MPNWCQNIIMVSGNEQDIKTILDAKMSFNAFLPCPNFSESEDLTGAEAVDWQKYNWGTKWDIVEDGVLIDGNVIELDENGQIKADVMTARSAPIPFFEHLTSIMEDLEVTMHFWEPGCELLGSVQICNGHTLGRNK